MNGKKVHCAKVTHFAPLTAASIQEVRKSDDSLMLVCGYAVTVSPEDWKGRSVACPIEVRRTNEMRSKKWKKNKKTGKIFSRVFFLAQECRSLILLPKPRLLIAMLISLYLSSGFFRKELCICGAGIRSRLNLTTTILGIK